MSHGAIDLSAVHYTYPDGTTALNQLSLHIEQGESVAIVGANGSGKTTLLSHLNGLLSPQSGAVAIGEYAVTPENLPHIRRLVGMVFQNPDDQLFMPTVYEDVAFGPLNLGLSPAETAARVTAALSAVGALSLKDRPAYRLSGGQKRAVAVAAVLSMEPAILVLDEPTAALDPLARRQLINLLKTFRHTKIIATHDLELALEVCERTVVISKGTVLAAGPTGAVFSDKALLQQAGLEQPLALRLCPVCKTRFSSDQRRAALPDDAPRL